MSTNTKKLRIENASIESIYEALSDNKDLVLFNIIALAYDNNDGGVTGVEIQIRKLGLTTRQYYSRITGLMGYWSG
jgi:hypothetical protein